MGALISIDRSKEWTHRLATKADLRQVLGIEQAAYAHPWTAEQFEHELQSPYSRLELLFSDKQLAGFICYWTVAGEMQILNVATAADFRRQGVARRLLEQAFVRARENHAETAFLEVRVSNQSAIALYRSFGFVDDCIRSKYYSDGEDALLMNCPLISPSGEGA